METRLMPIDPHLKAQLDQVAARRRRLQFWCKLAVGWAAAAAVGLALLEIERVSGLASSLSLPVIAALGVGIIALLIVRHGSRPPNTASLIIELERRFPQLDGRLLTAAQQQRRDGAELEFLQDRLLKETLEHSYRHDWTSLIPESRVTFGRLAHWMALLLFGLVLWGLRTPGIHALLIRNFASGITVTPGDTTLERGDTLVVLARFKGPLPATVNLVIGGGIDGRGHPHSEARIPLVKSLADPMFGGSVPEVTTNFEYHIAYAGGRTRDFKVKVFEYPRLERADASLVFPAYTGEKPKKIEDTLRITAVEGSRLDLALHLNKPVRTAQLVAGGEQAGTLPLKVEPNRPEASLPGFVLGHSAAYNLELVDAEGRTNKVPSQFVFSVLTNRTPELVLTSPRGDMRPSALQEITFRGTVWDDFGVLAYGLGYCQAGKDPVLVTLGKDVPGKQKRSFHYLLRLEKLQVQPDQLVSWFAWADDLGPDGRPRHTTGDLFFGEIRPFDEVFREGQGMAGGSQQGTGGRQGGGPAQRLAELQKQIINATWNIQRAANGMHSSTPGVALPPEQPAPKPGKAESSRQRESNLWQPELMPVGGSAVIGFQNMLRTSQVLLHVRRGRSALHLRRAQRHFSLGIGHLPLFIGNAKCTIPDAQCSMKWNDWSGVRLARTGFFERVVHQANEGNEQSPRTFPAGFWPSHVFGQLVPHSSSPEPAPPPASNPHPHVAVTGAPATYLSDLAVVRQALEQAIQQAQAASARQQDPRTSPIWRQTLKDMQSALERVKKASRSSASLSEALDAEQAAYQCLLMLQQHEYQVSLGRRQAGGQGGGSRSRAMQLELNEMDLTQSQNRYETQSQAQAPVSAQRREQLQISARLQELARRQQDLNDRLKELQSALEQARTEKERAEIRRRLKRLEEEERKMLSSVDALRQRMDSPQNQSNMTQERRQLDQTRQDVLRASQAAGQGAVSQALASGTRAQRQLRQVQDEMRRKSSSQFAQDLRQMREQARELAKRQDDILKDMTQDSDAGRKSLSESPQRRRAGELLGGQTQLMTNLIQRASRVSEQAEATEPLLSRQLYDTVRKFSQDSARNVQDLQNQLLSRGMMTRSLYDKLRDKSEQPAPKIMELTSALLRLGFVPQATDTAQRVRDSLNHLKQGVEQAASSVLGSDSDALRLAQQELNDLTSQLQREIAQGQGRVTTTNRQASLSGEPGIAQNSGGISTNSPQAQLAQSSPQTAQSARAARESSRGSRSGNQNADRLASSSRNSQPGGRAQGQNRGQQRGESSNSGSRSSQRRGGGQRAGGQGARRLSSLAEGGAAGGGEGGNLTREVETLLNRGSDWLSGPISGNDFIPWSERLRDVEDMVDDPALRNELAAARQRALVLRREFEKAAKKPDWAVVRLRVLNPLVEVQERIREELARRASRDALVPIDRDPVPSRYSELVQHYYEELGKNK
jgi:hypothetical protein